MLSLIQHLAGRPWAVHVDIAMAVRGMVMRDGFAGLRGLAEFGHMAHAQDAARAAQATRTVDETGAPLAARGTASRATAAVAVVPIFGPLTQRGDVVASNATRSAEAVADEVTSAAADNSIDAVVLLVDSPGGEVYGIPEAFNAIRQAAAIKPVVTSVSSVCASAALYLGSAATEIWVTPSGEIGSLGVYALHVDLSKALEESGEKPQFIVASDSPFKTEGNSFEPLSDDARASLQKVVDRYMAMFVRDVAKGRSMSVETVRTKFGQGRMLSPQDAVEAGMADKIGTFNDALRRAAALGRERRSNAQASASRAEAEAKLRVM
jgi:signal peptide peptidase SppA